MQMTSVANGLSSTRCPASRACTLPCASSCARVDDLDDAVANLGQVSGAACLCVDVEHERQLAASAT
jgi:hypothetical protein